MTKRRRDQRRSLPPDYLEPLVGALQDPAVVATIHPEELEAVAFQLALYFGLRREPETAAALGLVMERLVAESAPEERLALVEEIAATVRRDATSVLALLPVLQREREASVARAIGLAIATLTAPDGADPMTGPRTLRALLDHTEDPQVRAGLVGTLLALGDARVSPLLAGVWALLEPEARIALAALPRALASEAELDWWMTVAAEGDDAALIAGTLARLPVEGGGQVLALEREFPAGEGGEALSVLSDHEVSWHAQRLADALRALAARAGGESGAALLSAWGLSPAR